MKISIIGAGAMGGAITRGLLKSGFNPSDLTLSNPSKEKLQPFAEKGVNTTTDNKEAILSADVVFIAVKPRILPGVISEIKDVLHYNYQAISVVAASISAEDLRTWFDYNGYCPTISLSMPNTAIENLESMTFVVPVTGNENNRMLLYMKN